MTDIKKTAREAAERIFRRLPFGNVRDDTRHDMVSRIAEGIADVLRAQVATAEAAGMERAAAGWRDIATAPKDREILVWVDGKVCRARWNTDEYAKKPRPYWSPIDERLWGITWARNNQPTHWMPTPPAPGSSPGAGNAEIYVHIEGGRYVIVGYGELKRPDTGDWVDAVAYRSIETGKLYMTTAVRWTHKFTPVALSSKEPTP